MHIRSVGIILQYWDSSRQPAATPTGVATSQQLSVMLSYHLWEPLTRVYDELIENYNTIVWLVKTNFIQKFLGTIIY